MILPPSVSELTNLFLHEVDDRLPGRRSGAAASGAPGDEGPLPVADVRRLPLHAGGPRGITRRGRTPSDCLDPRWNLIARESLRLRENPGTAGLYQDPVQRGRDVDALLRWLIDDGTSASARA